MRILVVDDHPLIQQALATTLAILDEACEVDAAEDLQSALGKTQTFQPDLVLLDLGLPGQRGLSALTAFREARPAVPVVVVSGEVSRERVLCALDAGAMGYIPKTSRRDTLLEALRVTLSGGMYVPKETLPDEAVTDVAPVGEFLNCRPEDLGMTARQAEVCALMLRGLTNKLICRELDLAEGTVKVHVSTVLKQLGVANRTQAVLAAHRIGLRLPR